jgi:hypothetical protein
MPDRRSVFFVCVQNGAGDAVEVHTAGTKPGSTLNAQSLESLAEDGASIDREHPRAIDPDLLSRGRPRRPAAPVLRAAA